MNQERLSSTIIQVAIRSAIAAFLTISVGCSKNNSSPTTASNPESQATYQPIDAGTCRVTKIDGSKFENHFLYVNVHLDNEYFGRASEQIYSEGEFPKTYARAFQDGIHFEPSREQLLANAVAWAWNVDSKKDSDGNWTILTISKQILYAVDGLSYEIDSREVKYGEPVSLKDSDSGISINCILPTKRI